MSLETVKVCEICDFVRGLTYSKSDEVDFSNTKVLRATNIDLNTYKLNLSEIRYISDTIKIKTDKKVKVNDILICTASGSKTHLGKVAFIEEQIDMAFGGFMGVLRARQNVNPKFLFSFFKSSIFLEHVSNVSNGANINNLKFSQFSDLELFLPPLVTQEKIVTKLDVIFAEIDKATAAAEANIKNAETFLQATINKVSNFSVSSSESKIFLDIVKINSKLVDPKLDQFSDLIHVGAANIVSNTGELIDLKTAKEENLISGKFIFESDTILYSKIRPYLKKVAKSNFGGLCSADVYPLIPNLEFITHDFLFYLLLTDDFTNYAISGSGRAGMPKINREYLFAYKFNLPNIAEQNKLTEEIFKTFELIKVIQSKYLNILKHLTALKQSILQQAFNGELIKE